MPGATTRSFTDEEGVGAAGGAVADDVGGGGDGEEGLSLVALVLL